MSILTDDQAAMFADTAVTVPVVYGTAPRQETRGFLSTQDMPEPDRQGGFVLVSRTVVIIQAGSLTGLASSDTVTVDGTNYVLHDQPRSAGRGKTRLILAEV